MDFWRELAVMDEFWWRFSRRIGAFYSLIKIKKDIYSSKQNQTKLIFINAFWMGLGVTVSQMERKRERRELDKLNDFRKINRILLNEKKKEMMDAWGNGKKSGNEKL